MNGIYIGFSKAHNRFGFLSRLISWYEQTPYSHVYLRFRDANTGFWLIAEAGHGEVHLITHDNWTKRHKMITEAHFELEKDCYNDTMRFIFQRLQAPYSIMQNVGIVFYELFGVKWFVSGDKGYNCSELVKLALPKMFEGMPSKPDDFIKPSDIHKIIFGKK